MNYLRQIKGFSIRRKLYPVSSPSITLYYILLEQFNIVGFPQTMSIPMGRLQGESAMSESAIRRARKELEENGYIKLKKGGRNEAAAYTLVELNAVDMLDVNSALMTAPKETDKLTGNAEAYNKPNKTQTKPYLEIRPNFEQETNAELEIRFEEFWQMYPRKSNYTETKRIFYAINPDEKFQKRIIASLNAQISKNKWDTDQVKYAQSAANWLKSQGWNNISAKELEEQMDNDMIFVKSLERAERMGLCNGNV